MIDIHTHILPFVDDGSKSVNHSLELIKTQIENGVTDIFLTPHLRRSYNLDEKAIRNAFSEFCDVVKQSGIEINLYLGQEIYINPENPNLNEVQQIITLNDSKYLLIEFDFVEFTDIVEVVYEASRLGYQPIVCHFERYNYANLEMAEQVKENGGFIQINASSITSEDRKIKKITKQLLKHRLVDFVASDIHKGRENCMGKAYKIIEKKYSKDYALDLFGNNAKKIIDKV